MVKQVIIVRRDLNLSPGKLAAQVAHASQQFLLQEQHGAEDDFTVEMFWPRAYQRWERSGETIIVLGCKDEAEMMKIMTAAKVADLPAYVQVDEGRTEVEKNTATCIAIGPAESEKIDAITKRLRLY